MAPTATSRFLVDRGPADWSRRRANHLAGGPPCGSPRYGIAMVPAARPDRDRQPGSSASADFVEAEFSRLAGR